MAEQEFDRETRLNLDIGGAVRFLRRGYAVARVGWNGKGQFLRLQVTDQNSEMSLPYVYISTVNRKYVPWVASQTDLLAQDWMVTND